MRDITKTFPGVKALSNVNLLVEEGEILAVFGENGAGKSTLMAILHGFYQADAGDILVHGTPAVIRDSRDAIRLGIEMVHQHFMLVDHLTVLENSLEEAQVIAERAAKEIYFGEK